MLRIVYIILRWVESGNVNMQEFAINADIVTLAINTPRPQIITLFSWVTSMAQYHRFEDLPIALHLLYDFIFFITKILNGLIYISGPFY